jgi:hypothetical protein
MDHEASNMDQTRAVRFCIYCEHEKPWIWNGQKLKDGSKVYTNQSLCRWAGRRCPDCEKQRVQAALKCGGFEKDLILYELKKAGFKILSTQMPIRVEKDGKSLTVGVKKAFTREGKIVIESNEEGADVEVFIFQSVRIIPAQKLENLKNNMDVFAMRQPQSTVSLGG